jgi:hypothetical protein
MSWLYIAMGIFGLALGLVILWSVYRVHREREDNIAWFRKYVAKDKQEADFYADLLRRQRP